MSTVAAIYARLSRDKTKGTAHEGESLEFQVQQCSEWIERQGWTVGEVYRDNDISATSGKLRPEFERMLTDAPPVVVYRHQDRLERGTVGELDRFLLAGCEGYGTDGTRATLDSASGELITRLQSILGKHEQRLKAERLRAANDRMARAGKYRGSIRPFGQDRTGAWIEPEASAVREAVPHIISGEWSFFRVATEWNERGLLTPATGKQGGKAWTSGTVRNYFTRPRLYGEQDYKGTLYPLADWTPLLSREEWDAIQARINSKRTGRRVSVGRHDIHLLTGILRCAECGRGMNAAQRGGAGSTRLYKCPTVRHVSTAAVPVEDFIIGYTLHCLTQAEDGQAEEASEQISELVVEREALESEHEEWVSEAVDAGLKPSLIVQRESKVRTEAERIEAEIIRLRGDLSTDLLKVETIGSVKRDKDGKPDWSTMTQRTEFEGFRKLSREQQRDLIKSIIRDVTVSRAGQGKRFSPDNLTLTLTERGEEWAGEALSNFI